MFSSSKSSSKSPLSIRLSAMWRYDAKTRRERTEIRIATTVSTTPVCCTNFIPSIICCALFPQKWKSQNNIDDTLHAILSSTLRSRRLHSLNGPLYSPLFDAVSANCALHLSHLLAPYCSLDKALSKELQLFLLADNNHNNNNNESHHSSSSHSNENNNNDDAVGDENGALIRNTSSSSSSPATSMLLLDLEVPSIVATSSTTLQNVASQLLDYQHLQDQNARNNNNNAVERDVEDATFDTATTDEDYFTWLLTSTLSSRNNDSTVSCSPTRNAIRPTTSTIPSHLYPALLAYSDPSACCLLIERDAEARLSAIASSSQFNMFSHREESESAEPESKSQTLLQQNEEAFSTISEDEKELMRKISEMRRAKNAMMSNNNNNKQQVHHYHHHQYERYVPASTKAPIDPVVFLKLFGSILRNPTFSREDSFVGGHKSLLLLISSYSAQLPPSDSFSPTRSSSSPSLSSSSSFHGSVRNVVTLLLIRLSRLYGRSARALEFAELHRCLRENVSWMISMAPMLYWTWLLGSTLDAVRSAGSSSATSDFTASSSSGTGSASSSTSSSTTSTTNISSSLIVQRMLVNSMSTTIKSELEPPSTATANIDLEALAKLWTSFVPHLQEAVTIATSRLLDESSRKIRTTCIKVAILLDEYDACVANRCEVARTLGVPFTFQRLLLVYNTWGYHTVFFPNTSVVASSFLNKSSPSSSSQTSSSWSIDPKEATSQVIRLFGVAIRRGCLDLMIEHPAEFERPLLDFIEQINVDRPFALLDSTSHVLSILSEVYTSLQVQNDDDAKQHAKQDVGSSAAVNDANNNNLINKKRREGITKVATRIWEWLRAVIKSSGRGGWDPQTIAPIANSLEALDVLPKSPFWWQCGCGARNPSASIRCTMCLRRSAASSCHWTCASEKCRARQFIDSSALPLDSVKRKCVACASKHPWLATLEQVSRDQQKQTQQQQNQLPLLCACSKCLQVQQVDFSSSSSPHFQQVRAMLLNADGVPLLDLCGIGMCSTARKRQQQQQQKSGKGIDTKKVMSSATSQTFVENNFLAKNEEENNNNSNNNGLDDLTMAANSNTSLAKTTISPGSERLTRTNATHQPQPRQSQSQSQSISWTCHECATESTTPACSTCGLARDERVNMWCCDECGSWNFGDFPRCRRGCATKKRSTQRPVPYVRWTCGCGSTNPMWRLSCGRCCPKESSSTSGRKSSIEEQKISTAVNGQKPQQQRESSIKKNKMYTCPSCNGKPSQTHHRRIRDHLYRPGLTINSCGECGADHPRDLAVVRSVHLERPCVSCGDWHTLPGLVLSNHNHHQRLSGSINDYDDNNGAEMNYDGESVNEHQLIEENRSTSTSPPPAQRRHRLLSSDLIRTSSRTTCCSHCGCETDASAEPFSKWNCETCSYEEEKKNTINVNATTGTENSNNDSNKKSSSSSSTAWRTGYRCDVCGDLHPSLAFSVIRNGIAARLSNGDPHDAVFLWKCRGCDVEDPDSCCGQFNPSWHTKCRKCGQIRYVPPPMMTRTSPCHGARSDDEGKSNNNNNNRKNNKKMMNSNQKLNNTNTSTNDDVQSSSSNTSSKPSLTATKTSNGGLGGGVQNQHNQEEIRARYIPWSCESCHELRAPEDVLFCPTCANPRTPPPCSVCGGSHISLYCPAAEFGKASSSFLHHSSSSMIFGH